MGSGEIVIRDQTNRHLQSFRSPEDNILDNPWAGIGIDPYLHVSLRFL